MVDLKMLPKFISVEGINGSGKTTVLEEIQNWLDERAIPNVRLMMLPEGPLRTMVLTDETLSDAQRLLLIRCASLSVQKQIKEAIQEGKWVLMDRGWISYLVYQGQTTDLIRLQRGLEQLIDDTFPKSDFIIYLDLAVEEALRRREGRTDIDHFESGILEHEESLLTMFRNFASEGQGAKHLEDVIWLEADQGLDACALANLAMDMIEDSINVDYNNYLKAQNG